MQTEPRHEETEQLDGYWALLWLVGQAAAVLQWAHAIDDKHAFLSRSDFMRVRNAWTEMAVMYERLGGDLQLCADPASLQAGLELAGRTLGTAMRTAEQTKVLNARDWRRLDDAISKIALVHDNIACSNRDEVREAARHCEREPGKTKRSLGGVTSDARPHSEIGPKSALTH